MEKEKVTLDQVNQEVKATTLKNDKTGKVIGDYVEVNQRVLAFRKLYPEGIIMTDIVSLSDGVCVIKAQVGIYDKEDGSVKWLSNGYAYEKEDSTFINKTSYIENCETSAVGRALGFLGIGIDTSIASKEEVINAVVNQEENKPTILATEKQCEMIKNLYAEKVDDLTEILKSLNKKKIVELTIKEASDIISNFKKEGE